MLHRFTVPKPPCPMHSSFLKLLKSSNSSRDWFTFNKLMLISLVGLDCCEWFKSFKVGCTFRLHLLFVLTMHTAEINIDKITRIIITTMIIGRIFAGWTTLIVVYDGIVVADDIWLIYLLLGNSIWKKIAKIYGR